MSFFFHARHSFLMNYPDFLLTCITVLIVIALLSSVQSLGRVWLFATPWTAVCQASLSITNSRSTLRLTSIESVMPSSHLILYRPLILLPPIPPSIRVFSNESTLCMRWPKYWSFSFSISPSNEHPGLISFRMDWLDLLAVIGHYLLSPLCLEASVFRKRRKSQPFVKISDEKDNPRDLPGMEGGFINSSPLHLNCS